MTGAWKIAEQRLASYQRRAFQLQNRDGSFSTSWFDGPEQEGDTTRRLLTTGHVLELLAETLPEESLDDPQFQRAVAYVVGLLEGREEVKWHRGAMGHALHALAIYEERILGVKPGERTQRLAGEIVTNSQQGG